MHKAFYTQSINGSIIVLVLHLALVQYLIKTELLLPIPPVRVCVIGGEEGCRGERVPWIHVHNMSTCRRPATALHLPRQWCYPCHLGEKRGKGKCVPPCFPSLNAPLSYSPTQFFQSPRGNSIPKHTQEFPFLQFTNPPLQPHFKKRKKKIHHPQTNGPYTK